MRVKTYTLTGGGAASTTAFAGAQNTTANVALTLASGATDATLAATPREITLTSAADVSAVTFTVVGKDRWGNVITESISGLNNNTVQGRKVYSFITSITPSGSVASNMSAGYPQRVCSPWVINEINRGRDQVPNMQVASEVISGSPDLSVENTYDAIAFVTGEGAYVQASTDTTPPAVTSVQGTAVRAVHTATTGVIKVKFPRLGTL